MITNDDSSYLVEEPDDSPAYQDAYEWEAVSVSLVSSVTSETYSIEQIREAFAKHASTDDWGFRSFLENDLIAALRGHLDEPEPEPVCTCGAVEYGPLARHLNACALSADFGEQP